MRFTLLLMAGAWACSVDVDYAGSNFRCEQSLECPSGQQCIEGVCQLPPVTKPCPDDWWDCSFSHRIGIRFDNSLQAEDLTEFPIVILLDESRIDYSLTNDDGSDIRFVLEDDSVLPHEIEQWDEAGQSTVWVRAPTIPANTTATAIWMYFGNPAATSPPDNPTGVWNQDYAAVWHLGDPVEQPAKDSTANANHGAASPGMPADAAIAGRFGGALNFDGIDDWIEVPHSSSLDITGEALTLSAWVNLSMTQANDAGVVVKTPTDAGEYHYQLGVQSEDSPNFRVLTPAGQTYLTGPSVLAPGTWYYVVGIYDGATARVFLDGELENSEAQTGAIATNLAPVVIGRRGPGDERFFIGAIDEVRISRVARSDAWLAAQRLVMLDQFAILSQMQQAPAR